MASISRRTTAKGEHRYDVRVRLTSRVVTRTFKRREDADKWARLMEADVVMGVAIDPRSGTETVAAYAEHWLATRLVKKRPLAPRTFELYRDLLDRHIVPTFGALALSRVTPEAVRTWHADLARRVSPVQAAKAYRLFRTILSTAVDDRRLPSNSCRVPGAGNEHPDERPFVPPEVILKLAETIEDRYHAPVLLAAFGGLRLGELLALRRDHVDLVNGRVHIEEQAVQLRTGLRIVTPPKTEAGRRMVNLPTLVTDALSTHLDHYADPAPDGVLFTGPAGGPLRRATLYTAWKRARQDVGIEGITIHDLRHAGATLAAWTGASTKELMARLGHSSAQAALRYQHAAATRDRRIAERLNAVIEQARRTPPDVPASLRPRDGRAMESDATAPRTRRNAADQPFPQSGRRESNSRSQLGKLKGPNSVTCQNPRKPLRQAVFL